MTIDEQRSILAIALHAAFADGIKDDREREEVRRIAESLNDASGAIDMARLYQDVLLKRLPLEAATSSLSDAGQRHYAYEMAVCVCDADGRMTATERKFLDKLKSLLKLDVAQTDLIDGEIDTFVDAAEASAPKMRTPLQQSDPASNAANTRAMTSEAELDKAILNYALLNGALELLPQSWASMAIIPLQVKMVYGIGQSHGINLDQGHIKEFIAAAGVGLTSQYLEQFGRKLLGGLLGKAVGKTFGKIGSAAMGMTFSFATTYALGQVAKRYYGGGRSMNTAMLQDAFQNLLGPAKQLQTQYLPQIEQKARNLDMNQVMNLVRGN